MRYGTTVALSLLICLSSQSQAEVFSVQPDPEATHHRNLYFPPLASLFLPSFDQWLEKQYSAGAVYGGGAFAGLFMAASAADSAKGAHNVPIYALSPAERRYEFGNQLYLMAGELSAFHSFRTAVKSRSDTQEFDFLQTQETSADLFLAPFEFGQILRPTTFVPLILIAALSIGDIASQHHRQNFTAGDFSFAAGTAYNAGVGEEAFFRGYMMPLLRRDLQSDFWSNSLTALVFGSLHITKQNPVPVIPLLFGWYEGWLTQRNQWSLKQAVFLHAWWDVLILSAAIATNDTAEHIITLPGLSFSF